jgi:uncharacterized membrane protein
VQSIRSIEELTRRNVSVIAAMEQSAANVRTGGERIADWIASSVGSWTFIIAQTIILTLWIELNLLAWLYRWDPYPFILLNLVLSFQSAYAAPILMISQNRQAKLSERRHHLDLQVNMLAEQETTEILRLLRLLCDRFGVDFQNDGTSHILEAETQHAEIVRQIQGEIENCRPLERLAQPS